MNARRATIAVYVSLLPALAGCASVQSEVFRALGVGGKAEREQQRLARAQRAAQLTDEQIDRRIAFLTERLDENRLHAAAWKYGWLVVDGGGMTVGAVRAGLDDGTRRIYDITEAGKGAIGVAYLFLNPMPGVTGADPVRALPDATHADKLARLEEAEYLLAREAERARDRTSWVLHAGNVFLNAAAAAPVLAYGDGGRAALGFFTGTAAGIVQILTQPWEGPADWEAYERFVATDGAAPTTPTVQWRVVPNGAGLALVGRF